VEKRRLEEDIVKIRAQLRAAFDSLGENWPGDKAAPEAEADTSATRPTAVGEITEGGIRKVAG
jgi:hypothetical protein